MTSTSENRRPVRLLAPPVLLAALLQSEPVRAYDATESFSVGGILSGTLQCQTLTRDAGARDACRGGLAIQPELSIRPTQADEFFFKLGFAGDNGLNEVSPFTLAPWAADLQDDVKNIHGRWDYLLNAWYAHRFTFPGDTSLRVSGGVVDATDYLDENAYSNDEYTQFMNEALVNGPNTFPPSYDVGGAVELEIGAWSVRGVAMHVGENDDGESFAFFGGQMGYTAETPWGEGNYRALVTATTEDFLDPAGTEQENLLAVGVSFDQELGETVGAFVRLSWQDDSAAITHDILCSGGIDLAGGVWGRPEDNIGLGYGYLSGGNDHVDHTHVAEIYYRFVAWEHLAITADAQYMQDDLKVGEGPRGFILGLRITSEF